MPRTRTDEPMPATGAWRPLSSAALVGVAIALSGCGGSSPGPAATNQPTRATTASPTSTTAPATSTAPRTTSESVPPGPIAAVLRAPGHDPHVGNWTITVTLTKGGRPIRGHISYAYLFQGQLVSTQQVGGHSPDFVGVFHDTLTWPSTSVGYPLTFRVVIKTPYGVKNIDYPVVVQR